MTTPNITVEVGEEMVTGFARKGLGQVRPASSRDRGDGPFRRLVLRGATVIDGTGAPPWGPADIVIEGDRITEIAAVGVPGLPINAQRRPAAGNHEIDCTGKFVTPGFIDCHAHIGTPFHAENGEMMPADYMYKLWLAHGVTSVREAGCMNGLEWTCEQKAAADANRIAAPHLYPYVYFPAVNDYLKTIYSPEEGRQWLRRVSEKGAKGVKFFGAPPAIMQAALDECKRLGLRTCCHHAQLSVGRMNALKTAQWGLTSTEHAYGLPEALFEGRTLQTIDDNYNYNDEYLRFSTAGQTFLQAAKPGSQKWNDVLDAFLAVGHTFVPTMNVYDGNRDLMRARRAEWHDAYTDNTTWKYFQPQRGGHGAYFYRWSVTNEVEWRESFRILMQFLNEYKNRGGRVCPGSDSGFMFQIYGFGYIRELELFQEAGFSPLEVLRAATAQSAELLGIEDETGALEVGRCADILVHDQNPLSDFKLLYGTGALRLNDESRSLEQKRSIKLTIKGGVVFAVDELLADVRAMVSATWTDGETPFGPNVRSKI
ncbi:Imidazolonepropionase (plasmid) [Caballeronia sp. SBC1]|uniref:amidohydrolase family protein n=1 Tax=unclassified Caballeronia TaxID=2646786 RepID=UPI0013E2067C|nr:MULTISPECIES: amidohydrolase family protein [unclassified Caballeronia]QIE28577.1 Imidazolonepropionase [Caballeronia sp. SBC2]QIN66632.1 Imidazolonepropionase [Caballeronia sp. SBC1]